MVKTIGSEHKVVDPTTILMSSFCSRLRRSKELHVMSGCLQQFNPCN